MANRIAIVSLRFSPAFGSHLVAYRKAFARIGFDVEYILHPRYRMFPELAASAPISYTDTSACIPPAGFTRALFCNISVSNRRLASRLKSQGAKILYIYHEPWAKLRDYLANESLQHSAKLVAAHYQSILMLKVADSVIVPSEYGMETYRCHDIRYNKNVHCIPLLFDDEAACLPFRERNYFSFVGGMERSHGFDQYVEFIRYALREKLDIRFLIASKGVLPPRTFKEKLFQENMDRIAIQTGRPLTNREINECYAQSICVWNVYRRSTQSGVLPNAFMCGAPVVASRIGAFPESVEDGVTGRFAEGWNRQQIAQAFMDMMLKSDYYSENCRRKFLQSFYFESQIGVLSSIVERLHRIDSEEGTR